MRYKHPTPITDQLYKESSDDPNRDPDIHELRVRIQCEKFERALAELNEQHGKLKDTVQTFLKIMRIQEESDSGRVFHPNTIQSCRSHDLDRIADILSQLESMTNQEGESEVWIDGWEAAKNETTIVKGVSNGTHA